MELAVEKYKVADEPFYLPIKQEVELFEAAYAAKLPVMLKGPTGCGKTRFVEYMAYKLGRPLITVACHEDLSSTDLVGRFRREVIGHGTFSHDWFTGHIPSWEPMMRALEGRTARVLEIGAFEGLSTCFVLWRLPDATVTAVDTFAGSAEQVARDLLPNGSLEHVFDANVARVDGTRARKLVGDSKRVVLDLHAEHARFDFVYVDGSHLALDVLIDAALSWSLLTVEGFLVFDDYGWSAVGPDPLLRPGPAIDAFLELVDGRYEVVSKGTQLALRKTSA